MRILVTGALGHIGSRLIRELPYAASVREIVLLDNLATGRYCSLFNLPSEGDYEFTQADIMTADLLDIVRGVDAVIHLAAITDDVGVPPADVYRVNVDGTERVGRACAEAGRPLLFVSTTSIYGTESGEVDEGRTVGNLDAHRAYTQSKWRAERSLAAMAAGEGLRFAVCRFGTILGASPGMRFHTAVSKFCWQAVTGRPVTVWRPATHQMRPYLDVVDATAALQFLLTRKLFDCRVYNVVSVNATVRDVLRVIAEYVPALTVEHIDSPLASTTSYSVETRRLTDLGFTFAGSLDRGIRETTRLLARLHAVGAQVPR